MNCVTIDQNGASQRGPWTNLQPAHHRGTAQKCEVWGPILIRIKSQTLGMRLSTECIENLTCM